jgi:hypothetical protein
MAVGGPSWIDGEQQAARQQRPSRRLASRSFGPLPLSLN